MTKIQATAKLLDDVVNGWTSVNQQLYAEARSDVRKILEHYHGAVGKMALMRELYEQPEKEKSNNKQGEK